MKHEPDKIVVKLVLNVTAILYQVISYMTDDLLFHFFDLTFDRIGVRESGVTSSSKRGTQIYKHSFHMNLMYDLPPFCTSAGVGWESTRL